MADIRTEIRMQLKKSRVLLKDSFLNEYPYHFKQVEDGIYNHQMPICHTLMFKRGSGSELEDSGETPAKAKAIDSSSMLSYNFFHWVSEEHPLCLFNVKYTRVYFEVRLKTLKSSNAPANIDVVLVDKENKNVLLIESKFLEYLKNEKADFSDAYKRSNNYFDFKDMKNNLIELVTKYKGKSDGYYYGIKQNICHIIALCNLEDEKAREYARDKNPDLEDIFNADVTYKFINLIFDPCLDTAKEKYDNYVKLLEQFRDDKNFCKKILVDNRIYMSYSDLYHEFAKPNTPLPEGLLDYLNKRYIVFSGYSEKK